MKPIIRKELYLNKIVGNNDYETPEKPISEEEFFFAEILGEAVQAPEPLPRYQMYLAKIAGREIEIPYPEVRLEYFLAKAAGMEIEAPTPITNEEIFWANYAQIVEKELSGIPPLTFNAVRGALGNYRIYGNTVNGESVGNKTRNLFDVYSPLNYNTSISKSGPNTPLAFPFTTGGNRHSIFIPVNPNTTYTWSCKTAGDRLVIAAYNQRYTKAQLDSYTTDRQLNADDEIIIDVTKGFTLYTFTTSATTNMIGIYYQFNISPTDTMLNEGSTALSYEPYGYCIPITNNGETTSIYLDEPLRMIENEADYISYTDQKLYRVDTEAVDITLPALPTFAGTNTLSVDTQVQPSNVYIKYEGAQ